MSSKLETNSEGVPIVDGSLDLEPISLKAKEIQDLVMGVTEEILGRLMQEIGLQIFEEQALPMLNMEQYVKIMEAILPALNLVTSMMGIGPETPKYKEMRTEIQMRLIPKVVALAGSLLFDLRVNDNRTYILEQVATLTYVFNTYIDKLANKGDIGKQIAQVLLHGMEDAIEEANDPSGFSDVLGSISKDENAFKFLKTHVLTKAMIEPSKFDLGLNPLDPTDESDLIKIIGLKIEAAGYKICTYTAAMYMDNVNLFPGQDIFRILESPLFIKLNNIGATITRLADDFGDIGENAENGTYNTMSDLAARPQVIKIFCEYCSINFEDIDLTNNETILSSFVQAFTNTVKEIGDSMHESEELTEGVQLLLKIHLRTMIIAYVNQIGDIELEAQKK